MSIRTCNNCDVDSCKPKGFKSVCINHRIIVSHVKFIDAISKVDIENWVTTAETLKLFKAYN